jgi:hypothetical protein
MNEIGKLLIILGVVIVIIGALLLLAGKIPWLGRLPGDIVIQTGNISCFFPIATSILLSVILSILLQIAIYISRR